MSDNNFEMFQTEVCDTVEAPLPLKKFCPTCTPNKNYIAPDWRQLLEETYLDEAACEYRIWRFTCCASRYQTISTI